MKGWPILAALVPMGWAALAPVAPSPITVFLTGDTQGEISPCGCTKPMTGGIRRRLTAINRQRGPGRYLVLDNGNWLTGQGRQDELKAETIAEVYGRIPEGVINLTHDQIRLGPGLVESIQRLSHGKLIAAQANTDGVPDLVDLDPFVIVSSNLDQPDAASEIRRRLASTNPSRPAILLTIAGRKEAEAVAKSVPQLRLILYRSLSQPTSTPIRGKNALLVSPGEHGKQLVKLIWTGDHFEGYQVTTLGPEFGDDPPTQRSFATYLGRVKAEKLLDRIPRISSAAFVGSKACRTCHINVYDHWLTTGHARALASLEAQNQDRDPDCTRCHVVGLDSIKGFRDRVKTPELANVGCESCHGSGVQHSVEPKRVKLPKVTVEACRTCHEPAHSPGFKFAPFWESIKHPRGK